MKIINLINCQLFLYKLILYAFILDPMNKFKIIKCFSSSVKLHSQKLSIYDFSYYMNTIEKEKIQRDKEGFAENFNIMINRTISTYELDSKVKTKNKDFSSYSK
jgi:hypothetical protein